MREHIVKPGEHLSTIAEIHGFRDYKTIWDDAANAALRAKRDNPHVLHPGDTVAIPDRHEKVEPGATTQQHVFQVSLGRLFVRLKVRDLDFKALNGAAYELGMATGEQPRTGTTDRDAVLKEPIDRPVLSAADAEARVTETPTGGEPKLHKFDLKIGFLRPAQKLSGQQARLNNLGYFAGFDAKDLQQFRWAVEEFKEDHILQGKVQLKQSPTIVEETDDPDEKTGVVGDDAFVSALQKLHGC